MAELRKEEVPVDDIAPAGDGTGRSSDPNWTAANEEPAPAPRPRWGMWLASAALGVGVAGAAWFGSASMFEDKATQRVANRWLELRTCLLGARLPAGIPASKQTRFVALGSEGLAVHEDWPQRCAPYARALDDALRAPSVPAELRGAPSVTQAIADDELLNHGEQLDALYRALADADLPSAKDTSPVPTPPTAARPRFDKSQLASWGRVEELSQIGVRTDSSHGLNMRLLLPEERPLVCTLNDSTTKSQRWRSALCRAATHSLSDETNSQAAFNGSITLARFARGAASMLQLRDEHGRVSYFDAATGLRLWRARERDAQAVTTAEGQALVLELAAVNERGKRRKRPKLVRLVPGKQPLKRTLRLKRQARVMLLPGSLLWWQSNDDGAVAVDDLSAQRMLPSGAKQAAKPLGRLPHRSTLLEDCAGAYGQVHLARNNTSPPRYTVLFHRDGSEAATVDAGVSKARVTIACQERAVMVTRDHDTHLSMARCDRHSCREVGQVDLPTAPLRAFATVADRVVMVWGGRESPLRMRMGTPESFAQSPVQVLIDEAAASQLQVVGVRLVAAQGVAVLLLQGDLGEVYALRIDEQGEAAPISAVR